jgi:hypothetical protein
MQNIASTRVLQECGFTIAGEQPGFPDHGEAVEDFILRLE